MDLSGHTQNWCHHKRNTSKTSIIWCIEYFSHRSDKIGGVIESSLFSALDDEETKWKLRLYPCGTNSLNGIFLSLFLHLEKTNKINISAKYRLCLINAYGLKENICEYLTPLTFTENMSFGAVQFVNRKQLLEDGELLLNDKLTIYCEVEIMNDRKLLSGDGLIKLFPIKETINVEVSFLNLLDSKKFSDVVLVSEGRELRAHRNILAAGSDVFSSMFFKDIIEKNNSRVTIDDMTYETLVHLMEWLYGGKTPMFGAHIMNLLSAANKYKIKSLKERIEHMIRKNVCPRDACGWLILSDLYKLQYAKSFLQHYIFMVNLSSVYKTIGWQELKKSKDLFCECFTFLLEKKFNS